MERVRAAGLKLKKQKYKFGITEIPIGEKLIQQGVQVGHSKVDTTASMPASTDLEMVNYVGKFGSNLLNLDT